MQWRDGEIGKCRVAKAAPVVKPVPSLPQKTAPSAPPKGTTVIPPKGIPSVPKKQAAIDIDRWIARTMPTIAAKSDAVTRRLNAARLRRYQGGIRPTLPTTPRPAIKAIDRPIMVQIDQLVEKLNFAAKPASPKVDPSKVYIPPVIKSITYFPLASAIQPDMALVIAGSEFGNEPGRVKLHYMSGSGELKESLTTHDVDLIPLPGAAKWWTDIYLLVKVPSVLPGQMMGGERSAVITVTRPNGATAKIDVPLQAGSFPVVASVETKRTIGCCCPVGTEYWSAWPNSHTYLYWPDPARRPLHTPPCDSKHRPWVEPEGKFVLRGQRFGDQQASVGFEVDSAPELPPIQLKALHWTDTMIELEVPTMPIGGYFALRSARITITTERGRSNPYSVAFGPEMHSKRVSGRRWFDKNNQPETTQIVETPSRDTMLVVHKPKCDDFVAHMSGQKNDEGVDVFFIAPGGPFPSDVRITMFQFQQIDPADPSNAWSVFGPDVMQLFDVLFDPASLVEFGAKMLVKAVLFGSEGGYHAYPLVYPGHSTWDTNKRIAIAWKTNCPFSNGKPITYTTSFLIEGPAEALAKY